MSERHPNLERLIHHMAADIGATEAAAFTVRRDTNNGIRTDVLVHIRPDNSDPEERAAAVAAFKDVIAPCIAQARDGAIEVDADRNGLGKQFCIVTHGRRGG